MGSFWSLSPPAVSSAAPLRRRLRWLALSLVPVSLLLGVTAHLGTDIAAVPLLWVVPLALYLLSFILSFLPLPDGLHRLLVRLLPLLVLGLVFLGILRNVQSALLLVAHLGVLLAAGLVCHGELYRDRPPPGHLTVFYLWISIGGALGGLLNAVVAPLLLSRVLEYPLALVAACMLLPAQAERRRTLAGLLVPLALGLLCAALAWAALSLKAQVAALGFDGERALTGVVYALPLVLCYALLGSGVRFGIGVGAVILAALVASDLQNPVLYRERSFFGVMTVQADRRTGVRHLLHGTTLHGKQDPRRPREPLGYYHPRGPMGEIFAARRYEEVAFVGLGPGALAAYGEPGQRFTCYEIDPAVVRIAQDPRLFTYLRDARAAVRVVIGDARLRLAEAPDNAYDLLVLDAFSSDAIPVHLLTREALGLYLRKLRPGGVLALHISNRYFRLGPVVGRLAEDAGLFSLRREDPGEPAEERDPSVWVALARGAADLGDLAARPGWQRLAAGGRLWTDDFADPLSVLRWR